MNRSAMLIISVSRWAEIPTIRSGASTPASPWFSKPGVVVNVRIAVKDTSSHIREAAISPLLKPPVYKAQEPRRNSSPPCFTVKH
ncbi:hypothetical protein D3C76_1780690 [compost metagenome]